MQVKNDNTIFGNVDKMGKVDGVQKRTHESLLWMRNKMRELYTNRTINIKTELLVGDELRMGTKRKIHRPPGSMYMFVYDAKTKDKLPYWDKFPLVFTVEMYTDGFLGLNWHYLPIPLREKLYLNMMSATNDPNFNEGTRLLLSYKLIKNAAKYNYAIPCIKKYLISNVRSPVLKIPPEDWETALYLPVEKFTKKTKWEAWRETRSKLL